MDNTYINILVENGSVSNVSWAQLTIFVCAMSKLAHFWLLVCVFFFKEMKKLSCFHSVYSANQLKIPSKVIFVTKRTRFFWFLLCAFLSIFMLSLLDLWIASVPTNNKNSKIHNQNMKYIYLDCRPNIEWILENSTYDCERSRIELRS